MKVSVKTNKKAIKEIKKQTQLALIDTAEALKTDLIQSQTMPFDLGTMQNDSTFVNDKRAIKGIVSIVTDTKYARKVYFDPEIRIKQEKNPNAKQRWFDDYITGNKKYLPIKYYAKMLKRRVGN